MAMQRWIRGGSATLAAIVAVLTATGCLAQRIRSTNAARSMSLLGAGQRATFQSRSASWRTPLKGQGRQPVPTKLVWPPHFSEDRKTSSVAMTAVASSSGGGLSVLLSSVGQAIRAFSVSAVRGGRGNGLAMASMVQDVALATPPVAYFLALLAAGFGVPVSEDALCIFAGATLLSLESPSRRLQLVAALYSGVVLSDVVTFLLGRALRFGLLEPLRRQLDLDVEKENHNPSAASASKSRKQEYWNRLRTKLDRAGNTIGFVIRLSVGMRAPLMLLSGFTGQVSLVPFVTGTALGAIVSLGGQLAVGYSMRHNQKAVFQAVASFSSFVLAAPLVLGTVLAGVLLIQQLKQRQERQEQLEPSTTTKSSSSPSSTLTTTTTTTVTNTNHTSSNNTTLVHSS